MKFLEDHFDEYLTANRRFNLHPTLGKLYGKLPKNKMSNVIFYGPSGVGKYTQMLVAIKKYSTTELKYEKRMLITFNKEPVYIKMSDIHFEVNMGLLGCNSKLLWNELYTQIVDVVSMRPTMHGIVVCKNFHNIHGELLEVFYSYLRCANPHIHISFVLLTDNVSFIPDNILNYFEIIHVKRPTAAMYTKCVLSFGGAATAASNTTAPTAPTAKFRLTSQMLRAVSNIKSLRINYANGVPATTAPIHSAICVRILDYITHPETIVFLEFRDLLYDILICDIDIYSCIWFIIGGVLQHLSRSAEVVVVNGHNDASTGTHTHHTNTTCSSKMQPDPKVFTDIMNNTYSFLHLYNNNYRPIYHLERFMLMLTNHTRAHNNNNNNNNNIHPIQPSIIPNLQ